MTQTEPARAVVDRDRQRLSAVSRRLVVAVGALISTDLAGGVLSIAAGLKAWETAWSSAALLAAPMPMMLGQILLTWLSVRTDRRWAAWAAGLLAVACAASILSGFFDGGLRNSALSPALFGFQLFLLAITAVVGVLAGARTVEIVRGRHA